MYFFLLLLLFFFDNVVKLVGGGSVINGANPSSFKSFVRLGELRNLEFGNYFTVSVSEKIARECVCSV